MILIDVRHLEKTYYNEEIATRSLQEITFSVEQGEFLAIMGPSGSGKSTLLHILGFLDHPTGGEYRFDGKAMNDYTENELARLRNKRMGFVFQAFNLLPRATVYENVRLPLLYSGISERLWDEMTLKAIESVGLSHRAHYESSRLSGGEKQRVAIARALINNPQVIFADEPTGNLDSKSGQLIMDILQKLNEEKGHTVILITHETYTAEYAQRILYLLDGKIDRDMVVQSRRKLGQFIK